MIFKLLPLIAPILVFIVIRILRSYVTSILFSKKQNKSDEIIACSACGTYVHEDLLVKKFGKLYCSEDCFNQ